MSQDDLADAANCSKTYVSTLERGLHHSVTGAPPQPSKKTVEKIAIALGVPIQEALSVAFGVGDTAWRPVRTWERPGPIQNDPNGEREEARTIHEDLLAEFDATYFRFEGDSWFQKLKPSERIEAIRRIVQEQRERETKPGS